MYKQKRTAKGERSVVKLRWGLNQFYSCKILLLILMLQNQTIGLTNQVPVVQSVASLTSSLRVISLTVLADSINNILIFFAERKCEYSHFFSKKFQHICVSLDVNFNESSTNDVVSFEQVGPELLYFY